jgi:hypothetical protein
MAKKKQSRGRGRGRGRGGGFHRESCLVREEDIRAKCHWSEGGRGEEEGFHRESCLVGRNWCGRTFGRSATDHHEARWYRRRSGGVGLLPATQRETEQEGGGEDSIVGSACKKLVLIRVGFNLLGFN